MKELKEIKVQIEQEFKERWEESSDQSISDLSLILMEIQNKHAKNPNSEPSPAYHQVHERNWKIPTGCLIVKIAK